MRATRRKGHPPREPGLSTRRADAFAALALSGIDREYPNKPAEVLSGPADVLAPIVVHPAFYGCFDWHSSVHGHWMLVRLLRLSPAMSCAPEVRARLETHLTEARLAAEAGCFRRPGNRSFERPYGWAWLLRLALELKQWEDPASQRWHSNLSPLVEEIVALARSYFERLSYPVRTGVHPDTAFAMGQCLDYARGVGNRGFAELVERRARVFYGRDADYPVQYEPSGEDFFSSGLNEADLMRRVLAPAAFSTWFSRFAPGAFTSTRGSWGRPARVSDVSDPKITHLVGLNLSRAWAMQGIASALPASDRRRVIMDRAMESHARAGLRHVFSGHYEGEHWLATFAVYYLTGAGVVRRDIG